MCVFAKDPMVLIIILVTSFHGVYSLLPTALLENYDKRLAPYDLTNKTLSVNVSLPEMRLVLVHGQEQMVTLLFEIYLEWFDERLRYDPINFNNRSALYFPATELWMAPYNIMNSVESKLIANKRGILVEVNPTGRVCLRETYYGKVSCGIRIQRFPFDNQFCGVILANRATNITTLQYEGRLYPGAYLEGNSEFWIKNFSAISMKQEKTNLPSYVYFYITFERDTFYYILVIVIPSTLITALTITGVLLPAAGESTADPINTGLSSLLALSITLTVVADNIPRTATIPLIGWFVLICLGLVVFSVLAGLIFDRLRVKARKEELLPGVFTSIASFYERKFHHKSQKNPTPPKRVISLFSFLTFLMLEILLLCNLIVFLSFSWNRDDYSKIDEMDSTDDFSIVFSTERDLGYY